MSTSGNYSSGIVFSPGKNFYAILNQKNRPLLDSEVREMQFILQDAVSRLSAAALGPTAVTSDSPYTIGVNGSNTPFSVIPDPEDSSNFIVVGGYSSARTNSPSTHITGESEDIYFPALLSHQGYLIGLHGNVSFKDQTTDPDNSLKPEFSYSGRTDFATSPTIDTYHLVYLNFRLEEVTASTDPSVKSYQKDSTLLDRVYGNVSSNRLRLLTNISTKQVTDINKLPKQFNGTGAGIQNLFKQAPSLASDGVLTYSLPLACIKLSRGSTVISTSNIVDYLHLTGLRKPSLQGVQALLRGGGYTKFDYELGDLVIDPTIEGNMFNSAEGLSKDKGIGTEALNSAAVQPRNLDMDKTYRYSNLLLTDSSNQGDSSSFSLAASEGGAAHLKRFRSYDNTNIMPLEFLGSSSYLNRSVVPVSQSLVSDAYVDLPSVVLRDVYNVYFRSETDPNVTSLYVTGEVDDLSAAISVVDANSDSVFSLLYSGDFVTRGSGFIGGSLVGSKFFIPSEVGALLSGYDRRYSSAQVGRNVTNTEIDRSLLNVWGGAAIIGDSDDSSPAAKMGQLSLYLGQGPGLFSPIKELLSFGRYSSFLSASGLGDEVQGAAYTGTGIQSVTDYYAGLMQPVDPSAVRFSFSNTADDVLTYAPLLAKIGFSNGTLDGDNLGIVMPSFNTTVVGPIVSDYSAGALDDVNNPITNWVGIGVPWTVTKDVNTSTPAFLRFYSPTMFDTGAIFNGDVLISDLTIKQQLIVPEITFAIASGRLAKLGYSLTDSQKIADYISAKDFVEQDGVNHPGVLKDNAKFALDVLGNTNIRGGLSVESTTEDTSYTVPHPDVLEMLGASWYVPHRSYSDSTDPFAGFGNGSQFTRLGVSYFNTFGLFTRSVAVGYVPGVETASLNNTVLSTYPGADIVSLNKDARIHTGNVNALSGYFTGNYNGGGYVFDTADNFIIYGLGKGASGLSLGRSRLQSAFGPSALDSFNTKYSLLVGGDSIFKNTYAVDATAEILDVIGNTTVGGSLAVTSFVLADGGLRVGTVATMQTLSTSGTPKTVSVVGHNIFNTDFNLSGLNTLANQPTTYYQDNVGNAISKKIQRKFTFSAGNAAVSPTSSSSAARALRGIINAGVRHGSSYLNNPNTWNSAVDLLGYSSIPNVYRVDGKSDYVTETFSTLGSKTILPYNPDLSHIDSRLRNITVGTVASASYDPDYASTFIGTSSRVPGYGLSIITGSNAGTTNLVDPETKLIIQQTTTGATPDYVLFDAVDLFRVSSFRSRFTNEADDGRLVRDRNALNRVTLANVGTITADIVVRPGAGSLPGFSNVKAFAPSLEGIFTANNFTYSLVRRYEVSIKSEFGGLSKPDGGSLHVKGRVACMPPRGASNQAGLSLSHLPSEVFEFDKVLQVPTKMSLGLLDYKIYEDGANSTFGGVSGTSSARGVDARIGFGAVHYLNENMCASGDAASDSVPFSRTLSPCLAFGNKVFDVTEVRDADGLLLLENIAGYVPDPLTEKERHALLNHDKSLAKVRNNRGAGTLVIGLVPVIKSVTPVDFNIPDASEAVVTAVWDLELCIFNYDWGGNYSLGYGINASDILDDGSKKGTVTYNPSNLLDSSVSPDPQLPYFRWLTDFDLEVTGTEKYITLADANSTKHGTKPVW